jgi:hypothetical protein
MVKQEVEAASEKYRNMDRMYVRKRNLVLRGCHRCAFKATGLYVIIKITGTPAGQTSEEISFDPWQA